jgi:hypothetical protein
MAFYDTNTSGTINPEDYVDEEHYGIMIDACDMNNDGNLDACEIHACVIMVENQWRAENCPGYGELWCECCFEVHECPGEWNCADVIYVVEEVLAYLDTNNDG